MKIRSGSKLLAAAAVTGLIPVSSAMGTVVAGPLQDAKASVTIGSYISIHSEFWRFTDDITITLSTAATANIAGVGYAESISTDPADYLVTTIYGDDLNPSGTTLDVAGVNPASPDFLVVGGEHILGNDGVTYQSSLSETPTYGQLAVEDPQFDLTPFDNSNPAATFYEFKTLVPAAAVPEPASLAVLAGGVGLLSLRRRRHV